jgi:hypothetical protein
MGNSMKIPQKVKNKTTNNPSSGYIFKGNKSVTQRNIFTPTFIVVVFTRTKG